VAGHLGVGVIGVGSFARSMLLPAIRAERRLSPVVLCDVAGLPAAHAAGRHGFAGAVADERLVLSDPNVQLVFLATRHDHHAGGVARALAAGKHVFVEKPLALSTEELDAIEAAIAATEGRCALMVGYNRRFSPAARVVKGFLDGVKPPLTVSVRFNTGQIPADHWTQDEGVGGGRIVGEACHAIDLATFLVGSPPVRVFAESVGGGNAGAITDDQCFITLRHRNGAVSSVAYLAGGDKAFPKERVEVIGGGRVAVIDDFRSVTTCAGGRTRTRRLGSQDKGHRAEIVAFVDALTRGGDWPIPWADLRAVSLASILAVRSLREGVAFDIP
jgi:predicted dehydrogenase